MSRGLSKKLFNVWLHITDRYWAFRQPGSAGNPRHLHPAGWRPVSLRTHYLALVACLMLLMLVTLEALRQYSDRVGGLVFFPDTDDVSNSQSFAYNYVPVIIALLIATFWSFIDFDVLRLEPYFQLSRSEGCPASVLFINYNFGQSFITPIMSAKRGHWVVLSVALVTLLIRIFLPALHSALFELREVTIISSERMNTWSTLVDLNTQASWIAAQENSETDIYDAYFTANSDLQQSRSGKYAVAPVEIPSDDQRETTVWTLNQTIYYASLTCDDVLIDVDFPVVVNNTATNLSWDVEGLQIPDPDGNCTVDFSYDNVFFPDTDFLQVRYWEPKSTDTAYTSSGANKAFHSTGCNQFDLFGVLLSVNATQLGSNSLDTLTNINSSATLFGCGIQYYQAAAEITMHANSSITNTRVLHETIKELPSSVFNTDAFQSLLAHRAPYTSDMLFVQINETTGERTLTELPVISQNLGDLDPVLVLDTSKAMTLDEFTTKVRRGVKQNFILTMSRLFNPDASPVSVPAYRSTRQVAIAVVSFVARCSAGILGIGIILVLIMIRYYYNRPNILQSDPGSIGHICSMVTDVFGPSNVLADPRFDFHQFSTRELRRLLHDCHLQWFNGPLGWRLEMMTIDGSPLRLEERERPRVDPRPHFLVIPFFIAEFLFLIAVIVAMSLIISSLAKDGGLQHLSQSGSSFLQVVLSLLPSMVASSVGALCSSIHRNLSILEPWVHLQRGQATTSNSLTMNYACQNPWTVLPKAIRKRHVLLGLVSIACVANTGLTVVAGGIFTQQLTESTVSTDSLLANYSYSVFRQTDFAADFTEYDLIQTSITSGVPLLSWTSANHSFAPIGIRDPDPDILYSATTLGIGASLKCEVLSITSSLRWLDGTPHWEYHTFGNDTQQCMVKMTIPGDSDDKFALSINFLSPTATDDGNDDCQTYTVMIVGRWNYTTSSAITDSNTIALHCEPEVRLQNFTITFDQRGQIQSHVPMPEATIDSGEMYRNATVSLGQFNKVFAAIPQSFYGETEEKNATYVSSYDWAGFLVAQLYKRDVAPITHLDPSRLMSLSQTVYQWVYSTYFSLWRDTYLQRVEDRRVAENATLLYTAWCMVPSISSLIISMTIIGLDTLIVLIVFGIRRGRFEGPRIPRSIGSVMPWIANSRMNQDFRGTYGWTNAQRQTKLENLDKKYGFRTFVGEDGQVRFAVDEESPEEDRKTLHASLESGSTMVAKPPDDIELNVVENPGNGNSPGRTHEPDS
ncbi:hypothetical protein P175DRAFT_0553891 [Aspergillus ochraceoroseus IBT 24754]|uniref:Uncharacterized protein n=1 Tax=Aspergillus ochraceoroseus IBT 24754 TaxID=1392256 RepID=A0A2T5M7U7_9EURO|nr:uncharacterized protein P175DRAFT_0553891 [Aspergillus ochraceoroseus IBT 24754]PTU24604.1 hypothetical protein P175DRAFT_0553891 [Aspergillus ochraceoroseus IBT 24754]